MAEMAELGVSMFTDDGAGVQDDRLMRRALEYASGLGVTLAQHCEVEALAEGGHMHEGEWSSRLGIPGIPAEAEELMVFRDIALSRLTGAAVHFQHLSTAGSVELVRQAKARGLAVTAEATPHHFTLTHAEVAAYDPIFKVNPPLRTDDDVAAVQGRSGRRHHRRHRHRPRPASPGGQGAPLRRSALRHAGPGDGAGAGLTELVEPGLLTLADVLALMSWNPAAIAGSTVSTAAPSKRAAPRTSCVFDPARDLGGRPPRSSPAAATTPPMRGAPPRQGAPHPAVRGTAVRDGEATR